MLRPMTSKMYPPFRAAWQKVIRPSTALPRPPLQFRTAGFPQSGPDPPPGAGRRGAQLARGQLLPGPRADGAAGAGARRGSAPRAAQPAAASGGARRAQRTARAEPQTAAVARVEREGGPDLQVLPDRARPPGGAGGAQTEGTSARPRIGCRQRGSSQMSCAAGTRFSR